MRTPTTLLTRTAVIGTLFVALAAAVLLRPGVAFAHHVEFEASTTCDTYAFHVDYIGGSGDRYAEIRVNGVITQTIQLPGSGPDFIDDIFVLTGNLPTDTTVEVRLYVPQSGPDQLESTVSATIDEDATCTATPSPTPTNTPASTDTPEPTASPEPTDTPVPTATPTLEATGTPDGSTATPEPSTTPTSTPVPPTSTPRANTPTSVPSTSTPAVGSTPTFVSTVESLAPGGPEEPGMGPDQPQETASGLPNAGSGGSSAWITAAIALLAVGGAGLGLTTIGLRHRSRS